MSKQKWYVSLDGDTYGPYGVEEIAEYYEEGRIDESTPVSLGGGDEWTEFGKSNLFHKHFSDVNRTKVCPYCAEKIKEQARKCKHCGEMIDKVDLGWRESMVKSGRWTFVIFGIIGLTYGLVGQIISFVFNHSGGEAWYFPIVTSLAFGLSGYIIGGVLGALVGLLKEASWV